GKPLVRFEFPTGVPEKSSKATSEETARVDAALYSKWFERASLPTLKRVMIEGVLARAEAEKEKGGESFREWYADRATHLATKGTELGVDFGLPQRGLADREFHSRWFESVKSSVSEAHARDRAIW